MGKVKINKTELYLIIGISLLAAFLRLYNIAGHMTFLGDEGRDAIIVRRLLVNFDPILIGPGTSIGNMYLGPWYYYLIAPSLLFANFSPIGPSVFIALIGVLTVIFVWYVARVWFPTENKVNWGALIAAFLYSIAPTVIIYSRSSWNPNIMPFFALLAIWSIWKLWQYLEFYWLVILTVSISMALNSHYLGLILIPISGLFYLLTIWQLKKSDIAFSVKTREQTEKFIKYNILAIIVFLFFMSPLVIFDFRHGFINSSAIYEFFSKRQTTISARPWNAIPDLWPLTQLISTRLLAARNEMLGMWAAVILIVSFIVGYKKFPKPFTLLGVWIGISLIGLGLYKQHIYDHYFGFFYPAPFLALGGMFTYLIEKHKLRGSALTLTFVIIFGYFNLKNSPTFDPINGQLQRTEKIASLIEEQADDEKFNLAVIAERNYEDAYQYFLEKNYTGVIDIDPLNSDETITNKLYVVCELPEEKCDPTHSPKAEVANFGWSKISNQWMVDGITIYELVHSIPPEE